MKIIYYSAHTGGFVYEWHHHHTVHELRHAGHEVLYFNPVEQLGRPGSPHDYSEVLLENIKALRAISGCDLFFASATDDTILPGAVKEISQMGIPTVNLSCDDLSHPFRIKRISSSFDLTWSVYPKNAYVLKSYGANLLIQPWAANPHFFKPARVNEELTLGFVGSCYGARASHLALLSKSELPVSVYGKSPEEVYSQSRINHHFIRLIRDRESLARIYKSLFFSSGRACLAGSIKRSIQEIPNLLPRKKESSSNIQYHSGPSFKNMGKVFSQMAVSLGSIELSSTYVLKKPLLSIRLREFEVPMCGGVHLVNRFPELQAYFEEDKEMLFYGDLEEMVDKARFYLSPKHDAIRQRIRENARKRAIKEHTWTHRFKKIGTILGLKF